MQYSSSRKKYIYLSILALLLSSCGISQSKSIEKPEHGAISESSTSIISRIQAHQEKLLQLKATHSATISLGKKEFNTKLDLSWHRGEGIRIILTPFPLFEIARLWFTPEEIVVLDKINKVSSRITYAELSKVAGLPIDYITIEALLIGQVPTNLLMTSTITKDGDGGMCLLVQGKVEKSYLVDAWGKLLKATYHADPMGQLITQIDDYQQATETGPIVPKKQEITAYKGADKHLSLVLDWRKYRTEEVHKESVKPNIRSTMPFLPWQEWIRLFKDNL